MVPQGFKKQPDSLRCICNKICQCRLEIIFEVFELGADALKMTEPELISHAGLDSAVYLRIYLLGLKIFVHVVLLAWAVMVPVNWTNNTLVKAKSTDNVDFSDIDKLSISNIPHGSQSFLNLLG